MSNVLDRNLVAENCGLHFANQVPEKSVLHFLNQNSPRKVTVSSTLVNDGKEIKASPGSSRARLKPRPTIDSFRAGTALRAGILPFRPSSRGYGAGDGV